MAALPRLLALDPGARNLGWAASSSVPSRAVCGLYRLSGTADLGRLYAEVRACVEELVGQHRPELVRYAPTFGNSRNTSSIVAEALAGVQAVIKLVCYDHALPPPLEAAERAMRKRVLGRGDFGRKDEFGRLIPGSGRADAKALALNWAEEQGYVVGEIHDIADALVVWHYDRLLRGSENEAGVRGVRKPRDHGHRARP